MKEWIVETKALTKKFHNFTAVDQAVSYTHLDVYKRQAMRKAI